jgi:CubicO group peptidase (beta-lactamase class C family)
MTHDPLTVLPLSEDQFSRTWNTLKEGVTSGVAPGFVVGLWSKDFPRVIYLGAHGNRRIIPSVAPMTTETVFDLASITKVFATATLVAVLVDRGWLSWDAPVCQFFPDYPYTHIKICHLLSHTAGYVAWQPFWEKLRRKFDPLPIESVPIELRQKGMRELVFSLQPEVPPGVRTVYSDVSFLLLGFVLEEVTQMSLDQAVQHFLWQPMGVQDAYYHRVVKPVSESIFEKVAATENCPWRGGVLQGQVHDDNCWAMGGIAGHAGAFGTAKDVLQFSRALMEGFLSRGVLESMWKRVAEPVGCERTLGWDTPSGPMSSAGTRFSLHTVGHLGFTGTSLWIDVDTQLAVTLLSNRVHPSRENWKIKEFRPKFHDAIRNDLEHSFR